MATNNDATLILDQNQSLPTPNGPTVISGPANEQPPLDSVASTDESADGQAGSPTEGQQTDPAKVSKMAKVAAGAGVAVGAALGSAGTAYGSNIKDFVSDGFNSIADSVPGLSSGDTQTPGTGAPSEDPNAPAGQANQQVNPGSQNPQPAPVNHGPQPTPQPAPAPEPEPQPEPGPQNQGGTSVHEQAVDVTGDGKADGIAVDADHDGKPEGILMDTSQDGTVDAAVVDHDEDGIIDGIMVDENQDGTAEQMLVDLNNDGQMDAVLVDTDGNGQMDATVTDANQDGQLTEDEVHAVTQEEATAAFGNGAVQEPPQEQPAADPDEHTAQNDYNNNGDVSEWT